MLDTFSGNIRPHSIEDEIKDSFLSYAMSVIVSRALPDARDGLKPVHRRVLYAMHDLGLQPNRPYRKSATVVGECFVEGTLVHTEGGLKPIERLAPGDEVLMPDGYTSTVTQTFHNPPSPVVDVRLSNGNTMTVTTGQLYRVLNEDLSVGWEEARNLEGKTVLASSPRSLGLPARHPSEERTTEAYVAGLLVAEGYLTDRGRSCRVGVSMADREPLEAVEALCRERAVPAYWSEKEPQKVGHSPIHTLRFSGLDAAYEACTELCAEKRVPEWVLADRRLYAPFVAGYMDGDGHFRDGEGRREVVLTSASEDLLSQLQVMLADCGIHGRRTVEDFSERAYGDGHLPRYNVRFSGESASRFSRLVRDDLRVDRKRACARRMSSWERRRLNSNTECVPSEAIFEELSRHHLGSGWYEDQEGNKFRAGLKYPDGAKIRYASDLRDKMLSYRQIEEWGILRKLERIGSPLTERLQILLDTYNVLTVESVEDRGALAETYDVQIVDPSHELLVEGCAVHNCIGKYHPHGDSAVYDTLTRLAQDFSLRYPLVDGQGNFGSVDGDPPAAMRYTEARLTRMATEMLRDIGSDTVDFVPNFDESLRQPEVLPARFPNLLVNGSDGIAVGMATKIPPHNLGEVIDATVALIDDPDLDDEEIAKHIKGPDFPTGGAIVGLRGIRDAIQTGRGSVRVQAKAHTEQIKGNRTQIVVTEIPYQVNKSYLLQKIAELVKDRKLQDISDLRDESDRNGMRIVIELKREAVPKVVLNNLYKHTQMQQSFGVNLVALVGGVPRTLSYKQVLEHYVAHQFDVVTRRTRYELGRAKARAHILEGLLIALKDLDEVVATIRRSRSVETARKNLMKGFRLSERQAQAILDLRLQRLTAMERQKVEQEHRDLREKIEYLEGILADESKVYGIVKEELGEVRAAYADERRTAITAEEGVDFEIEDLIAEEEMVISISNGGYLKSVPVNSFRKQGRGGVGVAGMELKEGDYIDHLFITTTHHYMLFFTNKGKVYRLKVHQLPRMGRAAKGRHIANMLPLAQGEHIASVLATKEFDEAEYLLFATKRGIVKKTRFLEYNTPLKNDGIIAINLSGEDELISVRYASEGDEVVIVSRSGKGIRFSQTDARPMGRATAGVKGITLGKDDVVLSMDVISDDAADLFILTERGFGKRTPLSQYRAQGRGGQGVIAMKTDGERGKLAGVRVVRPGLHELMIVSNFGTTIRMDADSISRQGRAAQGVRVMNLRSGDSVSAIAKVISSRSTDADGATDELTLAELSGDGQAYTSAAGLPEPGGNGAVPGA